MSRLEVNVANPSARQALKDCGDMHRNLMSAFPQTEAREAVRHSVGLLYRRLDYKNRIELLMLSAQEPDCAELRRHGFEMGTCAVKDISGLKEAFQKGRLLRFELLAFPSRKVAGEGKNSRRVGLRSAQERLKWLERQGEKYGFSLCEAQEDESSICIRGNKKEMSIRYEAHNFRGILRIEDSAAFWQAYGKGIGPGKAYGMGMLLVAVP